MKLTATLTATLLALSVALSGCVTAGNTVVTGNKLIVVMPPAGYFNCPDVKTWPDPETLTDRQVALLIANLDKVNTICRNNMGAIYTYLKKAQGTIKG